MHFWLDFSVFFSFFLCIYLLKRRTCYRSFFCSHYGILITSFFDFLQIICWICMCECYHFFCRVCCFVFVGVFFVSMHKVNCLNDMAMYDLFTIFCFAFQFISHHCICACLGSPLYLLLSSLCLVNILILFLTLLWVRSVGTIFHFCTSFFPRRCYFIFKSRVFSLFKFMWIIILFLVLL